jgi:hypothetical protein
MPASFYLDSGSVNIAIMMLQNLKSLSLSNTAHQYWLYSKIYLIIEMFTEPKVSIRQNHFCVLHIFNYIMLR